jgi:ResB-like family
MTRRLIKILTSLRLTVICLGFAVALVFLGSLAQVDEGLYDAQNRWFRSFLVLNAHIKGVPVPIFPGGYLIGSVLLVNLIAAHLARFKLTWSKLGIHLTHAGIMLLLVGQMATDLLSHENQMSFFPGETRSYVESPRKAELVFLTDTRNASQEKVVAVPQSYLKRGEEIRPPELPFVVRVREFYPNSGFRLRGPMVDTGPPPATQGLGASHVVGPVPETKDPDKRNVPSAIIELVGGNGSLGTWWVTPYDGDPGDQYASVPQDIQAGGQNWRVALRWERSYLPYSVRLLSTKYDVYLGTRNPKNYQSRVQIENPARGEHRAVDIYMNNPLRYEGQTFYQSGMWEVEDEAGRLSTLEVVKNPAWLTPYAGCLMVAGGMSVQFLTHLIGFISKRRKK